MNSPYDHGNALNDRPAECYGLYCRDTGELKKIGETTYGENAYGPGGQRRYTQKYLDENNVIYDPKATGTKKEMYELQKQLLEDYRRQHGRYPEMNKNGR